MSNTLIGFCLEMIFAGISTMIAVALDWNLIGVGVGFLFAPIAAWLIYGEADRT
jgi:hypothetical protein